MGKLAHNPHCTSGIGDSLPIGKLHTVLLNGSDNEQWVVLETVSPRVSFTDSTLHGDNEQWVALETVSQWACLHSPLAQLTTVGGIGNSLPMGKFAVFTAQ